MDKEFLKDCLEKGMTVLDIEKNCDKKHSTILYWISKHGLNNLSKNAKLDKYSFEKIDSKEKAYALGFILADSSISEKKDVEISVALNDKEVVEYLAKVLHGRVLYDHTLNKKTRRFPRARMHRRIPDILKFTGGRLKEERHYPRVRKDLERYLIQGLFDSDGCITWGIRKDKCRIWQKISFTSQLHILEGVQKYLFNNLNISSVIRPKGKENCYILDFANKNDVLKFCEHIYPDEEFIILERKYLKYKALRLELEENGESNCMD